MLHTDGLLPKTCSNDRCLQMMKFCLRLCLRECLKLVPKPHPAKVDLGCRPPVTLFCPVLPPHCPPSLVYRSVPSLRHQADKNARSALRKSPGQDGHQLIIPNFPASWVLAWFPPAEFKSPTCVSMCCFSCSDPMSLSIFSSQSTPGNYYFNCPPPCQL